MTTDQKDQLNEKLAELMGWTFKFPLWLSPDKNNGYKTYPDFTSSLKAMFGVCRKMGWYVEVAWIPGNDSCQAYINKDYGEDSPNNCLAEAPTPEEALAVCLWEALEESEIETEKN